MMRSMDMPGGDLDWIAAKWVRNVCESWYPIFVQHGRAAEYRFSPVWAQTRSGLQYLGEQGEVVATSEGCQMAPVNDVARVFPWADLIAFPDDWQIDPKERQAIREIAAEREREWAALTPEEQEKRIAEAQAYLASRS